MYITNRKKKHDSWNEFTGINLPNWHVNDNSGTDTKHCNYITSSCCT